MNGKCRNHAMSYTRAVRGILVPGSRGAAGGVDTTEKAGCPAAQLPSGLARPSGEALGISCLRRTAP